MPAPMTEQSAGEQQLESLERMQQQRELNFEEKSVDDHAQLAETGGRKSAQKSHAGVE